MTLLGAGACRPTPAPPSPAAPLTEAEAARPDPPRDPALERGLNRAVQWMAAFPPDQLRFDAAIGLHALARLHPSPDLQRLSARALDRANRDSDNPLRRFWDPDQRIARATAHDWTWREGERRVNTNRVLIEALHCKEHGWREQTESYSTGPMRDQGGYQSTHALWALLIATSNGCREAYGPTPIRDLVAELATAQRAAEVPSTASEFDLYAERTLFCRMAGTPTVTTGPWLRRLRELQNEDGSWGLADPDNPYMHFHATMVASWAVAYSG